MKNSRLSVIIRVNNLDECRNFYRNALNLGEPVVDSPFSVEFSMESGFSLYLEHSAAPYLNHCDESVALIWECESEDEFLKIKQSLEDLDMPLSKIPETRGAGRFFRGVDPAGNVFWIGLR